MVSKKIKNILFLILGATIYSLGLKVFFLPNHFIDGGITGISMILSYVTGVPIGVYLMAINIPFLFFGYKVIGKEFAFYTLVSISLLALGVQFLDVPQITRDPFLSAIFGGAVLGIGLGIIIRYGAALDGTEIIAIFYDKRTGFSVGEIVLFFNLFIMGVAAFVYGADKALYSLIAYFVAAKAIDIAIEGFNEAKAVMIISEKSDEIAKKITTEMGKGATIFFGRGGYRNENRKIIYTVIKRLEITKIKEIVNKIDSNAFLTISAVHEAMNGSVKKK